MHTEHCIKIKITFREIASYPGGLTSQRKEEKKNLYYWSSLGNLFTDLWIIEEATK